MPDGRSLDFSFATSVRYDCDECGDSHVYRREEVRFEDFPEVRDCPHCDGLAFLHAGKAEPAELRCGHPDCEASLSMTGEELTETQAWGNGMGRGCAVEEIREKSGWTGDGWRYFCPSHSDWAEL